MKREEHESQTVLKVLRFLENLIHQPKEWISGAKLKLSEMKFPGEKHEFHKRQLCIFFVFLLETAMTLMNSYKEKGFLVRRIVFVHSILLYNSMSNFTDHEFDKEGLFRMVRTIVFIHQRSSSIFLAISRCRFYRICLWNSQWFILSRIAEKILHHRYTREDNE